MYLKINLEIYLCDPLKSDTYHIGEVISFLFYRRGYYVFSNKIDHASLCYFLLKKFR